MATLPSIPKMEKLNWWQMLAGVSATILVLSLVYPMQQIENRYVTLISSGFFLYSITEWSQWGRIMQRLPTGILSYPAKRTAWYHVILKIIALILIIIPLLKLIFGIEFFSF